MHNSQNSASSKDSFASSVLAQAKLLGITELSNEATSLDIQAIFNNIISKIDQKDKTSISEAPTFFQPDNSLSHVLNNLDSVREAMGCMAKRLYKERVESEMGEELLAKADRYNIHIPYEEGYINFLELIDLVDEYEELLTQAASYHINWNESIYDPVALRQEIENEQYGLYVEKKDQRSDFFATRGLVG